MSLSATHDVHPDFSDSADFALVSADGVKFYIASSILTRTSGFFRGMFGVPQPKGITKMQSIAVLEDARTIDVLLRLAMGLPAQLERLKSPDDIETVMLAAYKYDMPGAMEVLRLALGCAVFSVAGAQHAMRQYAVACTLDRPELAEAFAQKCASIEIDFDHLPGVSLQQLAHIMSLRQRRIASFISQVRDAKRKATFRRENCGQCFNCTVDTSGDAWSQFVSAVCLQFALHPNLTTALSQPEMQPLIRNIECASCKSCSNPMYSWNSINRRLHALVDGL